MLCDFIFLLIHIVIAFIYIPWSYKRLKYVYNNNCVERHIGIIFHRITVLSLDKIQYASIFQTPLQKTMAVADLVISVSGGIIILPCLEWERAVYIKNGICHTVPEIVNGNKK